MPRSDLPCVLAPSYCLQPAAFLSDPMHLLGAPMGKAGGPQLLLSQQMDESQLLPNLRTKRYGGISAAGDRPGGRLTSCWGLMGRMQVLK